MSRVTANVTARLQVARWLRSIHGKNEERGEQLKREIGGYDE